MELSLLQRAELSTTKMRPGLQTQMSQQISENSTLGEQSTTNLNMTMKDIEDIKTKLKYTEKLSTLQEENNQPKEEAKDVVYSSSGRHPNCADLAEFSNDIKDLEAKELEVLLDFTCHKGLHEHVKLLLDNGADPDVQQGSGIRKQKYPVLKAGFQGFHEVLRVMMQNKKSKTDFTLDFEGDTILHIILRRERMDKDRIDDCDYEKCLNLLLNDSKSNPVRNQMKSIINKQDLKCNTPLHYATQKWSQNTVKKLMDFGANIGIKNDWQEIPISKIRPETMKEFLDSKSCLKSEKDVVHEDFSLTFHYNFLARDKLPSKKIDNSDEEQARALKEDEKQTSDEKPALPETESLWYISKSKEHRHLLKHPVITSFLWYKWKRMRKTFNRNLRFYILFVFLLTWYIFDRFGSPSFSESKIGRVIWFYLMIVLVIGMMTFIWRDLICDIKDLNRRGEKHTVSKTCIIPYFVDFTFVAFMVFILIMGSFNLDDTSDFTMTTTSTLSISLIILLCILAIREFLQILVSFKRYVTSFENWIELTMIGVVSRMIYNGGNNFEENRHLAAFSIFLAWAELITMIGKHPKLNRLNIYVTMFSKVLRDFVFFLLWYSMFIVAFGFGFYIMLHKRTDGMEGNITTTSPPSDVQPGEKTILRCSNGSELEVPSSNGASQVLLCSDGTKLQVSPDSEEESYDFFDTTWLSLVKTSSMFVGELEFSDIPVNRDSNLAPLSYIFFLLFVLLVVVILMNLLTGLAVGDIGEIRQKAEIYAYMSQVETISYTESMMLGDPFDFLKNVPTVLSWIDSCSICSVLYKFGPIRRFFRNIGSGTLLFFDYLEGKKSDKIMPNKRQVNCSHTCLSFASCSCLSEDDMDANIIAAAKEIIVKRTRESEEESRQKKDEVEAEKQKLRIQEEIKSEEKEEINSLKKQLTEMSVVINSISSRLPSPGVLNVKSRLGTT